MIVKRPRDSQRQRVYNAEEKVPHGRKFDRVAEVEAFVASVIRSPWWQDNYPDIKSITITDGRRRRRATAYRDRRLIKMPRWSRTELIVLHEVAHIITPGEFAAHGREYCKNYLELVKRFLGRDTWEKLRDSFREHKVKWIKREGLRGRRPTGASGFIGVKSTVPDGQLVAAAAVAAVDAFVEEMVSMSEKNEKGVVVQLAHITQTNNPRCPCRKLVRALNEEGYGDWTPLQLVHDLALSGVDKDRAEFCRLVEKYETEPQDLLELAASRRQRAIQPIVVRPLKAGKDGVRYALVAGERRYLASAYNYAKYGDKPEIAAEVMKVSAEEAYDLAVQENLNRKDATEVEKGEIFRAYRKKKNPTTNKNFTLREIAARLNLDYQFVRNREALTYLSDADKRAVEEGRLGLTKAAEKGTKIRQGKTDQDEPVQPKKTTRNRMLSMKQAQIWFDTHRSETEDYLRACADLMQVTIKQAVRESDRRLKEAKAKEAEAA